MRVLVVEDDPGLQNVIREVFENESFQTDCADTGDEGYFLAEQAIHDLIVLDIMLPGMNGVEVVKQMRKKSIMTPVILLTAKDSLEDRVAGLDAGADDYIVKPFAVLELLARSRAVLRRRGTLSSDGDLTCGPIRLVPSVKDAFSGEQALKLTAKEYELLEFFLCNKEQILTREQIFDRIWGFNSGTASSAVDVYVHLLRKKLAAYGSDQYLQTIRGVGYLFKGEPYVQ
ncbi:MAG: DNA-binding response regulator [Paenibacillus sp.]|jgi:DNA-binding response OmpR family regulator|nr:DNA-binding response regulator [Paenibacillus sp.]